MTASITVVLTNIPFDQYTDDSVVFRNYKLSEYGMYAYLKLVLSDDLDCLLISTPSGRVMIANYILKLLLRRGLSIVYYDLILQRPEKLIEKIIARFKGVLLSQADYYYFLHKDISGYLKYYSLIADKARYVPFKANNMRYIDEITAEDNGYIFSAGISHRDYDLLFSALGELGYEAKVVIPLSRLGMHNTIFTQDNVPDNIELLTGDIDQFSWNELLAKSRIVVLPIIKDVLQPAGISVCLEAMAFGKPVVISKGTSVNGLITEDEAELYDGSDKGSLKRAISRIWNDHERRNKIAINGREYAKSLGGNIDLQQRLVKQLILDQVIK